MLPILKSVAASSMMERMLKRVGLQSSKKVLDTEKQQSTETEAATSSNSDDKDVAADDRKSPESGELQWCDLLSFRNVCAVGTADSGSGCSAGSIGNQLENDNTVGRRSRRSRVFSFHYLDLHIMEFKPRAITRRLCGGKKPDNELYRSNSFKFERFERIDDSASLQKQVSLCDEYSLPVDFVNKRRPHSFGAGLANWTTPSPNGEQVEIVEAYCDPRDSRAYLEPGDEANGKLYTSPDKDYSQPYTTDGSSDAKTPEEEEDGVYEDVGLPEDNTTTSPALEVTSDCVTLICVQPNQENSEHNCEEKEEDSTKEKSDDFHLSAAVSTTTTRRNPSPYYYGDLFRDNEPEQTEIPRKFTRQQQTQTRFCRKNSSLETPSVGVLPTGNSLSGDGNTSVPSLILSDITPCSSCSGSSHNAASSAGSLLAACLLEWDAFLMPPHRQLRGHQELPSVCACAGGGQCLDEDDDEVDDITDYDPRNHHLHHHHKYHHHYRQPEYNNEILEEPPVDYDVPEEGEDDYSYDMSGRQRHLYETAFDCKVSRSDDDLDDVDRVTNHPVLQMFGNSKVSSSTNTGNNIVKSVHPSSSTDPSNSIGIFTPKERRKITLVRGKLVKDRPKLISGRLHQTDTASSTTTALSQDLDGLELDDQREEKPEPSPPLPLRGFSPSPPSTAPLPAKFHGNNKDILAMNSIRSAPNLPSTSPAYPRLKDIRLPVKSLRAREHPDSRKGSIMEFKGRPISLVQQEENIPEFKGRPRSMFTEGGVSLVDLKGRPSDAEQEEKTILEFKGRPVKTEKDEQSLDFSGGSQGSISKESKSILEFKGRPASANRRCGVRPKYSSTESMATSSSGGSLESIRSSTSEGNRSTTSSESHRSSSLSSHSSDSGSSSGGGSAGTGGSSSNHLHHYYHYHYHHHHHQCSGAATPLGVGSGGRFFAHQSNKLHILSPISDKSSQEPVSETSDNNRNNNSQKASPEDTDQITTSPSTIKAVTTDSQGWGETTSIKLKRRTPQNKNVINLTFQQQQSSSSGEAEIQGSDSGISIESRGGTKGNKAYNLVGFSFSKQGNNIDNTNNLCASTVDNELPVTDFSDLPFDMPKLRRRRLLQQDACTSGSATSVDLHELPFDMPKLRRRLRVQPPLQQQQPQTSTESSGVSQASSSQSVRDADRPVTNAAPRRPSLTLNLEGMSSPKQRLGLSLNLGGSSFIANRGDSIDVQLPLERQGWYHGAITRVEAENVLRLLKEGSYLVRNSESTRQDYSLSLKSARGFMHMRIQQSPETGKFILGQFSKPFDSIPEMIHHYTVNRLPIRGAEHMCLLHPVIEQLL